MLKNHFSQTKWVNYCGHDPKPTAIHHTSCCFHRYTILNVILVFKERFFDIMGLDVILTYH